MMTGASGDLVRQTYLDFFQEKGHTIIPSSSLIPHGDPTLLLTSAGMVQIKPYFLGEATPPNTRLTSAQKCFRTTDIDVVGNERNLTFFEMMGNFSVGDYFKAGAIEYAWELSTQRYGLPADKIWISIYPDDEEAYELWRKISGVPPDRIVRLDDNWWGPAGETGPTGPDSELYIDRGPELGCGKPTCGPGCDCQRFLEFWNLVFMQYFQDENKVRTPLPKQNVDTGLGLERMSMLLQGKRSVYETDLFLPIINTVAELAGVRYGEQASTDFSLRVIADHSRAVTFLVGDGVSPSNEGRGYILRRVLRRAVRHGRLLGIGKPFLTDTAQVVMELMNGTYPELGQRREFILRLLDLEENRFHQTLNMGIGVLEELMSRTKAAGRTEIPGEEAFKLYDTFGFPVELTLEIAAENGLTVGTAAFEKAMEGQRALARSAAKFSLSQRPPTEVYQQLNAPATQFVGYSSCDTPTRLLAMVGSDGERLTAEQGEDVELVLAETPFYGEAGGQVGDVGTVESATGKAEVIDTQRPLTGLFVHTARVVSGYLEKGQEVIARVNEDRRADIARHHSVTHLLHKALQQTLGGHAQQSGSLVAPDRLRFDFTHPSALSKDELAQVERLVNRAIRADLPVETAITGYREAIASGAMALFDEKYGEQVRLVQMGDYSRELCGGTHVRRTGEIGFFHILSETSVGTGLRRVEAVAGRAAEEYVARQIGVLRAIEERLPGGDPVERLDALHAELQTQRREIARLERALSSGELESLLAHAETVDGVRVVAAQVAAPSVERMREMGDWLRDRLGPSVVVLGAVIEGRPSFIAMVSEGVKTHAGQLIREVAAATGGSGGGRPNLAQAGGRDASQIGPALAKVAGLVHRSLAQADQPKK